MYCENCGAALKEGAAFCANCGAPVAPKSVETPAAPVYQQPAAPVYAPVNATNARRPLIVPAILAIVAAVLFFVLWCVNLRSIPYFITEMRNFDTLYYGYLIFRYVIGNLFPAVSCLFLFLFCLVQYRRGTTTLFGLSCLMLVIAFGIMILSFPVRIISNLSAGYGFSAGSTNILYTALETAVFVLLLICMPGAFKKRINKIALIVAAALILTDRTISLVSGFSAISFFYFLAYALLAVALLLVAILWKKPAEENE